jgi:short-subunit dehydrogenase
MQSLDARQILITGAAGGFGQSLVKQLLPLGARLLLTDVNEANLREHTARTLKSANLTDRGNHILGYFAANLADPAGATALFDALTGAGQVVDILINNAGIGMSGHFADIPADQWETLMQVNLLAPMRLTALALPGMLDRRHGHIVNVASSAGLVGAGELVPYSASKFGLRGFSEALAGDLQGTGVAVTAIYPFFARTPILDSAHYGAAPRRTLPDNLIYDPDFVMGRLIDGIRRRKLHVYPGRVPKMIDFLRRFAPGVLPRLMPAHKEQQA